MTALRARQKCLCALSLRLNSPPMREAYIQRGNKAFESHLERRTAQDAAGFLLPHLRPGMRVLDVGSGPGTITLGLAEHVAPGMVTGIDLQPKQVERARELARERGLANVRFEVGDATALPFDAGAFDAALAHMVFMHLPEPARALGEMRRALSSDGVVGLRDADLATTVRHPSSPLWERFLELRRWAHERQGSDGSIARRHREVLREAGFGRSETRATTMGSGSNDAAERRAPWLLSQLAGFGPAAIADGRADQATVDAIAADITAWARHPDAVFFTVVCETVGWVRA